jgi:NAD(P)-dependent dehydrogenase (short-subunit alcohol dehydrogenase family)
MGRVSGKSIVITGAGSGIGEGFARILGAEGAKVAAAFKQFVEWAGSFDVLFNNAGFNKPMPLMEVTEENWNAITQATARGLAQYNITCNSFSPGVVDTPLWVTLDKDLLEMGDSQRPGPAMEDFSAGILKGRPATAEDLQGMALFLASQDSDYMTGQTIMIHGGMVLV